MAHCALLSQSFLDAIGADDILIPMFSWKMEDGGRYPGIGADGRDGVVLEHGDY